jgi:DNA end-binding protein Ku
MAPRASWKGYLKLSLVSCPVRLYTATTSSGRVAFNMLHKDTHNRVQMKPHDPDRGEVERADLVKGYEYEKGRYVVLTDEDFDTVRIESTDTIGIERFVDANEIDPLYLDSPYYMAPDGAVAEETFRVIREAMHKEKKAALSRVVLSGRERLVLMTVRDKGFVVTTLRNAREVRDWRLYFEDIRDGGAIDDDMLALATQLIEQRSGAFDPAEFTDRYEDALLELIKAKAAGETPVEAKEPERGKVINLMDALKRSLEESGRKPPAPSKARGTGKAATGAAAKEGSAKADASAKADTSAKAKPAARKSASGSGRARPQRKTG